MPKITNCATQVLNVCARCNTGYDLSNNICIYHVENCLKSTGTVCTQCADGFILGSNGKCSFDPFAGLDLNCRLYDLSTFNKCLSCSGGFFLNTQGKC